MNKRVECCYKTIKEACHRMDCGCKLPITVLRGCVGILANDDSSKEGRSHEEPCQLHPSTDLELKRLRRRLEEAMDVMRAPCSYKVL